jgi:predicted secreted Zn-dependent protease
MRTLVTIATLILLVAFGHGSVVAQEASPSAAPTASATPAPQANPVCVQAFASAAALAAATPAPGATPLPTPAPDRLDAAIRSCSSLEDWVIGSFMHPGALMIDEPLEFLVDRCTDPTTGLDAYATCNSLATAMATPTPAPTPSPTPAPTPKPTATPTATPGGQQSTAQVGTDGRVRLPRKLSAKVPGATKVRYFAIGGQSASTLIKQTLKRAKPHCGVHNALACVNLSWRVQTTQSGSGSACTIQSVTWTLAATVHLPRWTKPNRVDPALLRWWRKVLKQSARHEAQHVKIQRAELGKLRGQLVGRSCSSFQKVLKRIQKRSNKAQATFDKKERSKPLPLAP